MNCRKIQSILSAYLDGELTGEEMIAIREHLSICQTCSDEHVSLQVVKKLLGSLDTVDADGEWPSTITARAYAGSRPWWEKAISLDSLLVHFGTSANAGALTPRGIRMARALALSTVVVFLAAVPISSIELLDQGVTGRMAGNVGLSMLHWNVGQQTTLQNTDSAFVPDGSARYSSGTSLISQVEERYVMPATPPMAMFAPSSWQTSSQLTFVSSTQK